MSYSVKTTKCPDGTFYGAVSDASGIVVAMSPPLDTRAKARGWAEREARRLDADPTPPAAHVASDPVPAHVPCYLAISTDAAGVETVLGVFRVAEHASAAEAEREASKLCDRIRAAAPGARCDARPAGGAENAAANAALQASAIVPLGGRYVALADGGVEWVADAPAMVPQVAQQQQAKAGLSNPAPAVRVTIRDNACRAEYSAVAALPTLAFEDAWRNAPRAGWATDAREAFNAAWFHYAANVSSATRGDATVTIAAEAPAMVPQPCQPQQACAVRVTFQNDNPDTVWNKLAARLGRQPTNAEAAAEVKRILRRD